MQIICKKLSFKKTNLFLPITVAVFNDFESPISPGIIKHYVW